MRTTTRRHIAVFAAALLLLLAAGLTLADTAEVSEGSRMYATFFALVPPIIAIALALITKEVYSSLFVGILVGALFHANFNPEQTLLTIVQDGFIAKLASNSNVGILIFLVVLGIMAVIMERAGGSAAYGRWASKHIKTKAGALMATFFLGVLIFVDDYFNCLTVGNVMRPVTDRHRISRAKLAYLIDSTAAPICMIAPISSWAAAVAGVMAEGDNGLELFISAIPYNFYSLLTICMIIAMTLMKFDYGPMRIHEENAEKGDLFTTSARPYGDGKDAESDVNGRGRVIDLVIPVIVLVICCVIGMIYTGGFFSGESFILSFANCDASFGLALGSLVALVLTFIYYIIRRVLSFHDCMKAIPDGFRAMVPAILILTFAWTLSAMTNLLGADVYVAELVKSGADTFTNLLPVIIFLVAVGLSFATGTSWGTFGILLPIVTAVLPVGSELLTISVSACLAGAVCGDHCSPISDTTIMSSTGAQSDHVNHVSTQLPYAFTVAVVSAIGYVIAGFVQSVIVLPIMIAMMVGLLFIIRTLQRKRELRRA